MAASIFTVSRSPLARFFNSISPFSSALRPDDHLPGQADQVHRLEFGARPFVGIVIKNIEAGGAQAGIELVAGRIRRGIASL